jgi:hypothetical protein
MAQINSKLNTDFCPLERCHQYSNMNQAKLFLRDKDKQKLLDLLDALRESTLPIIVEGP